MHEVVDVLGHRPVQLVGVVSLGRVPPLAGDRRCDLGYGRAAAAELPENVVLVRETVDGSCRDSSRLGMPKPTPCESRAAAANQAANPAGSSCTAAPGSGRMRSARRWSPGRRRRRTAGPRRPPCRHPSSARSTRPGRRPHSTTRGAAAGRHDHVLGAGRAVHEIPPSQRPLLALDHEHSLTREHQEILLVSLPVVHRHRLAGSQRLDVDPDLREVRVALEVAVEPAPAPLAPSRLRRVHHEPAVAPGDEPVLGRLERLLGNHR